MPFPTSKTPRTLGRKKPLRPGDTAARARVRRAALKRSKKIRKVGKKGRASLEANKVLKAECERLQIYSCEVGFEGCRRDDLLTFAHCAKRRELLPGELETKAVLCCQVCHRVLDEEMGHAEMRAFVERKLAERPARYDERRFSAA